MKKVRISKYLKLKYLRVRYFKAFYNKIKNRIIINFLKKKYDGDPFVKQTKINNYNILVFVNDGIGRQIFGLKQYELVQTQFLKKVIKENWINFDIGSNIGYYTLLLAKLSPQGQTHAFEPNKLVYDLLNLNTSINNLRNVFTNNVALGDRSGYDKFNITKDSGFSSFKDTKRMKISKVVKIKTKTIDSYMLENKIEKVDFIKIDAEGAEKLVLAGGRKSLKKLKPKIISIEVCKQNLKSFRESGSSIVNFLNNFGYIPHILSKNRLSLFDKKSFSGSQNIYFVYKDYCGRIR